MDQQLETLAKLFLKFPGIGERQARRFAYFILTQPDSYVQNLSKTLVTARSHATTCTKCLRIFEGSNQLCEICGGANRDHDTLMVVEKSQDIDSMKRTDYHGLFFVLGGLIPIVQKNVLDNVNTQKLLNRVTAEKGLLTEIILAFPLTPNGDHTDLAIRELLEKSSPDVRVSSLGRGLSTGSELEYADTESLNASIKKRE